MKEIEHVGLAKRGNDSRNYRYSIFECPECLCCVEKKTKDGINAKYCSHSCYAKNRGIRGPYKEYVMISGYRYVQSPDHPRSTKNGYVAEHRLVAESKIGRLLSENEDVHHMNEIKTDNRPENLIVLTKSEHAKLHRSQSKRNEYGQFTI